MNIVNKVNTVIKLGDNCTATAGGVLSADYADYADWVLGLGCDLAEIFLSTEDTEDTELCDNFAGSDNHEIT